MIDRRAVRSFDWGILGIMLMLSTIGVLFVMSTTYQAEQPYSYFFHKQLLGTLAGYAIFILFCCIDYRRIQRWGYFAYGVLLVLLIFTMVKGKIGLGARRWINFGLFTMQPSELAKLLFPAMFTYFLLGDHRANPRNLVPLLIVWIVNFLLIAKQPDLGTAIVTSIAGFVMLFHARIGHRFFLWMMTLGILASPLLWHALHPYQKQRVLVFLGAGDTKRERYQIEQARIAIGSGGLTGKGFLHGTQNTLQFLPESRTDFIFAIICEELGFIGALCVILLYALLFWRMIAVIRTLSDHNTQLLALGLVIPIMSATVINIGMVLELLPVVGIPLPFITYGLTHSWISYASMGWFQGIAMRRFYHNAHPR